ncbi:MAG: hypothetical protein V4449_02050 [Patescibacteria group bacterium]
MVRRDYEGHHTENILAALEGLKVNESSWSPMLRRAEEGRSAGTSSDENLEFVKRIICDDFKQVVQLRKTLQGKLN